MRYIKTYESTDSLYQKLTKAEYDSALTEDDGSGYIKSRDTEFSNNEIKLIENWSKKYTIRFSVDSNRRTIRISLDGIIDDKWSKRDRRVILGITISTPGDEWYYVGISRDNNFGDRVFIAYKCDQIDGFINLMEYLSKECNFVEINYNRENNLYNLEKRLVKFIGIIEKDKNSITDEQIKSFDDLLKKFKL